MARAQRVAYFQINLEDKAGSLLALAQGLKSKNLGLVGLGTMGAEAGQAGVYLIAKNPDKLRGWLKSSGVTTEEGTGFFLRGADKTGALVKSLEPIAQAGINIVAIDAIAVGGKYGTFFRVPSPDVEKTAKLLGAE